VGRNANLPDALHRGLTVVVHHRVQLDALRAADRHARQRHITRASVLDRHVSSARRAVPRRFAHPRVAHDDIG
jgi:hypothetical protein